MSDTGIVPRRRRWSGVLLVAVVACAAAGWFLLDRREEARVAAEEAAVAALPPVERAVQALGEVLPVSDLVTIAGPSGAEAGRIARIDVTEGEAVAKGQVLAVLDTEPLMRAQLDQAVANEAMRRAALDTRIADLAASEAQLAAERGRLQAMLDRAQFELDKMAQLSESGLYEATALRQLELDRDAAAFALANVAVQLDRAGVRNAHGQRLDEVTAEAELAGATAARVKAEIDHAMTFIRAPIDGRVLSVLGRVGQQVDSGGFGVIGETGQMLVRAEVYETDIIRLAVDQPVSVTSRAIDGTLEGRVASIGARITQQSIMSTDPAAIVDARVVEVWIALDPVASDAVENLTGLQVLVRFLDPEESA
jgi:HlyD family secretion protein